MIDITHKSNTLRIATAQAIVRLGSAETMERIRSKTVPKGDVLVMAKTAGLLGIKQTANLIPDCHPLPIEYTDIQYELAEQEIKILLTCKTIYKTGVEVEAMHGASIVALTIYDMLKPIDKKVSIHEIKLLEKSGGKSDYRKSIPEQNKTRIITCSNAIARKDKKARAAQIAMDHLKELGIEQTEHVVIAEQEEFLLNELEKAMRDECALILVLGSSGSTEKDIAAKVVQKFVEVPTPGIIEAARMYGLQRSPLAMLSNGVAGFRSGTLILSLPGSSKGAKESMEYLFPFLFHIMRK